MSRRLSWLVIAGSLVLAASLATGVVLAFGGGSASGGRGLTPAEYRSRVAVVCEQYGLQLDQIAPPSDLAIYGDVVSSFTRALPVVKGLAASIRAIQPPEELRARVERLAKLRRRSIALLTEALADARRRDLGSMGKAVVAFFASRDEGGALAKSMGLAC